MRDKNGLLASALLLISTLVFLAGFILLFKKGVHCFFGYYKDFAANIIVAALTLRLLTTERKIRKLQQDLSAKQQRAQGFKPLIERGVPGAIEQSRAMEQKAMKTKRNISHSKKEILNITTVLAVIAIISALLGAIAFFI